MVASGGKQATLKAIVSDGKPNQTKKTFVNFIQRVFFKLLEDLSFA
jgi:hypothetical protein